MIYKPPGFFRPEIMNLYFNDEKIEVESNCKIYNLLDKIMIKDLQGVAVAVNESVISRSKWEEIQLKEGDKILVITATQGG